MPASVHRIRTTVSVTEFNAVKHRLAELNSKIEVLQRKSGGGTKANAEVAKLKAQVKAITAQLKLAGDRHNDTSDPAIKASAADQVWALDSRLDELFGDLDRRLNALQGTVDEHTGLLAEHGSSIDSHTGILAQHDTQFGMLNEGHQSLNVRVSSVESAKRPVWHLVVGIVAGLIAGIIWNNHTFGDSSVLNTGQLAQNPYGPANSWVGAALAGIVAMGLVLTVLSFIKNRTTRSTQTETTTTDTRREANTVPPAAQPVAPPATPRNVPIRTSVRETRAPREPIANPAPTQTIAVEPGVQTGARS